MKEVFEKVRISVELISSNDVIRTSGLQTIIDNDKDPLDWWKN